MATTMYAVEGMIEHVGFDIVPPRDRGLRDRGDSPATRDVDADPDREAHVFNGGVTS